MPGGVPIVHPCWVDAEFNATGAEPTRDGWRSHWDECIHLAATSDITVFLALANEQHAGALAELGACLGAGKQLFAVSAVDFSFLHHARCRTFSTLSAAIEAVMARSKGDDARSRAIADLRRTTLLEPSQ